MRLQRLILDNYIGIYNGMGLDRIEIDFTRCIHKILVIKGDNGSGKSTVFRALSPLNDSSSEYIYNKDAGKEIEYLLNDGSVLNIKYWSQAVFDKNSQRWIHKSPKCSIQRIYQNTQPIELNPSGNVTTAKDIIYELFQLDDNFMVLSALSSSNKGIGSLRPSDRKKYVNSVISSLSDFISMNKMLTKKGSILKSMLNSLIAKLDQIGNIEMTSANLKQDQIMMDELDKRKTVLIEELAKLKTQMEVISANGDIIEQYETEVAKYKGIKSEFEQLTLEGYSEEAISETSKLIIEANTLLSVYTCELDELVDKETNLRNEFDNIGYKIDSLNDAKRYEDICSRIADIESKIQSYEQELEKIGFKHYNNIYADQYTIALDSIEEFNNTILNINDSYDNSIINSVVETMIKHQDIEVPEDERVIEALNQKADELLRVITTQSDLQQLVDRFKDIPSDCQHTETCPFIKNIVDAKKKFWTEKEEADTRGKRDEILKILESIKEQMEIYHRKIKCKDEINALLSATLKQGVQIPLSKFFGRSILSSEKEILDMVRTANTIDIDLGAYWDRSGYLKMIETLRKDREVLVEEKSKSEDARHQMSKLSTQRDSVKDSLDKLLESKQILLSSIKEYEEHKIELENRYNGLMMAKASREHYDIVSQQYNESREKVKVLYEQSVKYKELSKQYNTKKLEYNNLTMNDLPLLSSRIEKAKYALTTYSQYKRDYDQYMELYHKLQIIKEHSSINGIQAVYIEAFLNSMLKTTNELLRLLFNGRFMIKEFVVNESEFSIPCIDSNGQERPDISDMSDSQLSMISMIISFVLLYQASDLYNIIKLDEVDASLDNTNRLQFATLIGNIIGMLGFEQCIIISHNNEIDLTQVDMMLFKVEKREELSNILASGANIIFSYNKL